MKHTATAMASCVAAIVISAGCASQAPQTASTPPGPTAAPRRTARTSAPTLEAALRDYSRNRSGAQLPRLIGQLDGFAARMSDDELQPGALMPLVGFFCHALHDNPARLMECAERIGKIADPRMRHAMTAAVYLSGCQDATIAFLRLLEGIPMDSQLRTAQMPPPRLDAAIEGNLVSTEQIDYCWGAYLATGDVDYALRVFERAVDSPEHPEKINGEVVDAAGNAARWSTISFMQTDEAVRQAVNSRLLVAPQELLADFTKGVDKAALAVILDGDIRERLEGPGADE